MLKIFIPTLNRLEQQTTYYNLPAKVRRNAVLVCPPSEYKHHTAAGRKAVACPVKGIGKVRQWILDNNPTAKLVMLDDDLKFDTRRKDDLTKFVTSTEAEVTELFEAIEKELRVHTHVGVLAREGGNRVTDPVIFNTRMLRVLAYNAKEFHKAGVRYDRLAVMEDFDVTLQLLRKGHQNAVLCGWVNGQGSSNAPGGCSTYRTMEVQEKGARGLAAKHAPFVKLVTKQTKTAWNGQERVDVMVQWKKAFQSSQV